MLGRIFIWLFYALIFFLIGVWSCNYTSGVRDLMRQGLQSTLRGVHGAQNWALGTVTPKPGAPSWPSPGLVDSARAAFSRGDVSQAVTIYQEHLKANPDDVDGHGELGNVLFSSGRLQEAAQSYFDAASRMAAKGDVARARSLMPAIRRGSASLAEDLEKALAGAKTGG